MLAVEGGRCWRLKGDDVGGTMLAVEGGRCWRLKVDDVGG